jgi:hypothetical protein
VGQISASMVRYHSNFLFRHLCPPYMPKLVEQTISLALARL